MHHLLSFDVDQKVEMLQKISSKERNRDWSKLERPSKLDPALQENRRGIILVPLQIIGDPSAVRRRTPSEEVDFGPGNTETEAPESTRNSLSERMSFRNRRE